MPGRLGRREGGREKGKGGKWEQELLIDGPWLAYIIHYMGQAPDFSCVWQRGLVLSV